MIDTIQAQGLGIKAHAMTRAQFEANAEQRKREYAGSGFAEWGKHFEASGTGFPINEGMWQLKGSANNLRLGRTATQPSGVSRTDYPVVNINGVQHDINFTNTAVGQQANLVIFPPAEDGTRTYNSVTGAVVEHDSSSEAFATETATIKVITSRQDLVFLETWHEKISDKDIVVPLGNVQYGSNISQDSIPVWPLDSTFNIDQRYSAFGEWDSTTKGNGARWSTITEKERKVFLENPQNNIYYDSETDELIQVRYRIRSIRGLGNDWAEVLPAKSVSGLSFANKAGALIAARGLKGAAADFSNTYNFIGTKNTTFSTYLDKDIGAFVLRRGVSETDNVAYDGKCFAMPIALVQRQSQAAYHPVHAPEGCCTFQKATGDANHEFPWHSNFAYLPKSKLECFTKSSVTALNGKIGGVSGRDDQYDYYDAIYAGQVEDLRLNANKQDVNKLRVDAVRKAVAGTMRGKGRVPFFKPFKSVDTDGSPSRAIYSNEWKGLNPVIGSTVFMKRTDGTWQTDGAKIVRLENTALFLDKIVVRTGDQYWACFYLDDSQYDSLPYTNIIGDPARIAATFPNGVVGEWIPDTTTGVHDISLTRKSNTTRLENFVTTDNGASWNKSTGTIDPVKNAVSYNHAANEVNLWGYESLSDFTESSNNSKVVGSLESVAYSAASGVSDGNRLIPSLTGKIGKSQAHVAYNTSKLESGFVIGSSKIVQGFGEYVPKHFPINLGAPANNSPAAKALSTVTEKDGLLYLQLHGNELHYDSSGTSGNEWGDTAVGTSYKAPYGTVPVIDKESTKTDGNGHVVKTFCHHSTIPLCIANNN